MTFIRQTTCLTLLFSLLLFTVADPTRTVWAISTERSRPDFRSPDAHYGACKARTMIRVAATVQGERQIKMVQDSLCNPNLSVMPRIDLVGHIDDLDDRYRTADFATAAGERKVLIYNQQIEIMKKAVECFRNLPDWGAPVSAACDGSVSLIREKVLPQVVPFRVGLALARSPSDAPSTILPDHPERMIDLAAVGIPLQAMDLGRKPLGYPGDPTDERNQALREWNAELTRIRANFQSTLLNELAKRHDADPDGPQTREFKRHVDEFERSPGLDAYTIAWPFWQSYQMHEADAFRDRKRQEIFGNLEIYRVLAYLKSARPDPAEMTTAFERMIANASRDRADTLDSIASVKMSGGIGAIEKLTANSSLNEQVLAESPGFCGPAESLYAHANEVSNFYNIVTPAAMALSFAVPAVLPAEGVALWLYNVAGAVSPSYLVAKSYSEYSQHLREALSVPVLEGPKILGTVKDANAEGDSLRLHWAMLSVNGLASYEASMLLPDFKNIRILAARGTASAPAPVAQ